MSNVAREMKTDFDTLDGEAEPKRTMTPRETKEEAKLAKRNKNLMILSLLLLTATVLAVILFIMMATGAIKIPRDESNEDGNTSKQQRSVSITQDIYGRTHDGYDIKRFTFKNKNGMEFQLITLGGIITTIKVPDKNGNIDDVTLAFSNLADFEQKNDFVYFGSLVGRYAGRIEKGEFSIDGTPYKATINWDGTNSLHGGDVAWHEAIWESEMFSDRVVLSLISPDGDQGYPGEVHANVTFQLTENNELYLHYKAIVKGKPTIINLTSHPYFNLGGAASGTIYNHIFEIFADKYLPIRANPPDLIPTGEIADVEGTIFDMRTPKRMGDIIGQINGPWGVWGDGHDHTYCLQGPNGIRFAARVYHPPTGRQMEVYTDQPALQFYVGNYLNFTGKGGAYYGRHYGFCMESENYPDAINHPNFPDCVLRPGSLYEHRIWYKFTTR